MNVDIIQRKERWVDRQLERESLPVNVKQSVNDYLKAFDPGFLQLSDSDGFRHFVLEYISREADRTVPSAADLPEHLADAGVRSDVLCTCGLFSCPVKQGNLYPEIENAESLADGVARVKHVHPGSPVVLIEARDQYFEELARVNAAYRTAKIALSNEVPVDELLADERDDGDAAGDSASAQTEVGADGGT